MVVGPRRRRGRLQPRLHLPEGVPAQAAPRGPRPPAHAAGPRATASSSRRPGTRRSRRSTGASPRSWPSTAATRSAVYLGNPTRTTCSALTLRPGAAAGARHAEHLLRARPSTRCPSRSRPGLMFGTMLSIPVPDVDRTDHLLILGANPLRLERQPADRARHARPPARASASAAARSWWSTRAARAPPRRPTSTTSSAPAPTRCCWSRWRARSFEEGLVDPGALARARQRARRGARAGARLHARGGGRPRAASPPSEIRRMARELAARRARRGVRADRHLHAGVRHARELARRRAQRAHRQPRPRGRRDVHARRRGPAELVRRAAAAAAASRFGRWQSRVRGLPEALRRAAGVVRWPRRSTRRARARSAR